MALRPGRTIRKTERPFTRVSKRKPKKSYVVGVPHPRIHVFEMGNKKGDFNTILYLVSKDEVQIRDNALEAARIVSSKFIEKKVGPNNYFMKILVYPHHVIREHSIAMGAGADRFSQGMKHAFGRPKAIAAQIKKGQRMIKVMVSKENIPVAKQALKRASLKLSPRTRIVIEE